METIKDDSRERDKFLRETLKARAKTLLAKYTDGRPPYNPFKVAEGMGVVVKMRYLSGLDGYVEVVDGRYVATINQRPNEGRQRFTLAHELCHVLLMQRAEAGMPLPLIRYRTKGVVSGLHQDPQEERLCNYFAGELLIPSDELRPHFLNQPVTPSAIWGFAKMYDVSAQAAAVQIMRVSRRKTVCCAMWSLESLWPLPIWWCGLKTADRQELQLLEGIVGKADAAEVWESYGGEKRSVKVSSSASPELRYSLMVITAH